MAFDQPDLEPVLLVGGKTGFRVEREWRYMWASPSRRYGLLERQLRVPAGFLHDGASIPRIFWSCLGLTPSGLTSGAGLVHDVLYRYQGLLPHGWIFERPAGTAGWKEIQVDKRAYTRKRADQMFHRMLHEAGVRSLQCGLAYFGVRAFGWLAWRPDRPPLVEAPE